MSVFRFLEPFRDPARELDRLMSIRERDARTPRDAAGCLP